MESIWNANISKPYFPALSGTLKTDVLIIGGGITGLLCAYLLQQAGVSYVLLEENEICSGITANTTAKITSQHGLIYSKLVNELGIEQAQLYLQANQDAISNFKALAKLFPCDYEKKDAYVYALGSNEKLFQELSALEKLDFHPEFLPEVPLPMRTAGAIRFAGQGQFHPLRFLFALAKGLHIFEHSGVVELANNTAVTHRGKVTASKIIIATHFPILNKHGMYFLKLYQQRSYVMALKNAQDVSGMYIDCEKNGLSFRNYGNLLLLGGGGHRTGKQGGNWAELTHFAQHHYPNSSIVSRWATQDCMSLDGIPYIGQYSKSTPNLYVATGYNKWGMTSAMTAATILQNLVQDYPNPYGDLFSPSRNMLKPQLAVNGWESASNLLSLSKKRCPHLGCALKWNPQEHSWDCPCHGSRFAEDGHRLDNPATGDLKKP